MWFNSSYKIVKADVIKKFLRPETMNISSKETPNPVAA